MTLCRSRLVVAATGLLAALLAWHCAAQEFKSERGPLRVVTVTRGLDHPWGLAFLPDGRMLVTERTGNLRIVDAQGLAGPSLRGVPQVQSQGQGGLLDVALDPRFAANRMLYLSFAESGDGGAGTAVARAVLGDSGLEQVRVIFRQQPKVRGALHFGSRIVPSRDGSLFVTLGERGQRDRAQELGVHLGKVVRIRPDGSVPPDNPFVGRAGALPEIWSYGHRNVQGAVLHPGDGSLWTVEHGAMGGDEVNRPQAGRNHGWPVITYGRDYSGLSIGEGTARAGMEQPLFYWDPSIAPSGMAFYNAGVFPEWKGSLLVGSLKFGLLSRLELDGNKVRREERLLQGLNERIRDVRVGPDGLIYLLTDSGDGRILRVEPAR